MSEIHRVLLKMSGAAIEDPEGESFLDIDRLDAFAAQVATARAAAAAGGNELQISIVVGGGNILRGESMKGVRRVKADYMGMLATMINSLALQDALARHDVDSRVMSGLEMPRVAESYIQGRALKHLSRSRVVIFGGGTGNPFFTTDTTAALRASEIDAEIVLLAKDGTDGVYDRDPNLSAEARKFAAITFDDLLVRGLQVMDRQAVAHCREQSMPVYVFNMEQESAVHDTLLGDRLKGTLVGAAETKFAAV